VKKTTKIKRGNATAKKILKLSSIADNMKKMKKEMIPALPTNNYY